MKKEKRFREDVFKALGKAAQGFTYKSEIIESLWGFKGSRFSKWDTAKNYATRIIGELIDAGLIDVTYHENAQATYQATPKGKQVFLNNKER